MQKKQFINTLLLMFLLGLNLSYAQVYEPGKEPKPSVNQAPNETKFPESDKFIKSNLNYKIINAANSTFGYDIFADGKLMIHQPSMPGMPGNNGFKNKVDAEKIAQLVITKIKKGEMPPTVTTEEMKKLKVIQ
jgi:hypothetical protein